METIAESRHIGASADVEKWLVTVAAIGGSGSFFIEQGGMEAR